MKLKLAAAVLALVVASPAFAAEYYIIQSASSKKCSIVNKKPTSDKATLVGDGTSYNTKKEARTAAQGRRRVQGLIAENLICVTRHGQAIAARAVSPADWHCRSSTYGAELWRARSRQ